MVFAVMGYIIAHQKPDSSLGSQVRINAVVLATVIGTSQREIEEAIDFLCSPDPLTTTPDKDGRRLVKVGQFDYQVVNGAKYLAIRNEEMRREQNRDAQARHRAKADNCAELADAGDESEQTKQRSIAKAKAKIDAATKPTPQAPRKSRRRPPPGPNPIQPGLVTDTETMAKLVVEYGEDVWGDELTPEERMGRVKAKKAAEEKLCEEVRAQHNPEYAPGGSKWEPVRDGITP